MMISHLLSICLLSLSLDGGGLAMQDASHRRFFSLTPEITGGIQVISGLELSLGYGIAVKNDSFPGLEFRTVYHRIPVKAGYSFNAWNMRFTGLGGAAAIIVGTGFQDQKESYEDGDIRVAGTAGFRIERIIFSSRPEFLGRAITEIYFHGRRTDILLMLGIAWRP